MIRDTVTTTIGANTANPTYALPGYAVGDTIFLVIGTQGNVPSLSGWDVEYQAGTQRVSVFSRVTDGSEGSSVQVTMTSTTSICCAFCGPGLTFEESAANDFSTNVGEIVCPDLTTTQDNCQIIRVALGRFGDLAPSKLTGQGIDLCAANAYAAPSGILGPVMIVRAQGKVTPGTVGTAVFWQQNQTGHAMTFAIASSDASLAPIDSSGGLTASKINIGTNASVQESIAISSIHTKFATINGITVDNTAPLANSIAQHGGLMMSQSAFTNMPADRMFGVVWPHAAEAVTDCQTVVFALSMDAAVLGTAFGVYLEDSSGNKICYEVLNRPDATLLVQTPASYTFCLSQLPIIESVGSIDLDDIVARGIFQHCMFQRFSRVLAWRNWANVAPTVVTGSLRDSRHLALAISSGYQLGQTQKQGKNQRVAFLPYQIGDGTKKTSCNVNAQPWEQPTERIYYRAKDGAHPCLFAPSPESAIDVGSTVWATTLLQDWGLAPTSNGSVLAAAATVVGYQIQGRDGQILNGFFALDCPKILARGCRMRRIQVSATTATDAALRATDGADFADSIFIKNGEDYAIEFDGTGDLYLNGVVFNSYTTPINILSSSGTVTIHLNIDDDEPAYDTAGASVVFDKPVITATIDIAGAVENSLIYLLNVDEDTVVFNDFADGYYEEYDNGTTFTAGQEYLLIISYVDGATAKCVETYSGIVTASGFSVNVSQKDCVVYNAIGLDGSALTGIEWHPTDIDIDLDGSEVPHVLWRECFARYMYQMYTKEGIQTLNDAMIAIDIANYIFSNEVVINNKAATPVRVGGDGFARRADGGSMFGSIGIQIDNSVGAIAIPTGGSAVLPSDITSIAAATKATMEASGAKLADVHELVDVAVSTRLAAADYSEPPSAATIATATAAELENDLLEISDNTKKTLLLLY